MYPHQKILERSVSNLIRASRHSPLFESKASHIAIVCIFEFTSILYSNLSNSAAAHFGLNVVLPRLIIFLSRVSYHDLVPKNRDAELAAV